MFTHTHPELRNDLSLRWSRLQKGIQHAGADALIISSNVNIFYLTGRIFLGYIYMPANGEPWFFVRRPCGLTGDRVESITKPEQIVERLAAHGEKPAQTLLIEDDDLTHSEWLRLVAAFPAATVQPGGSSTLRTSRRVKTPYEIRIMKKTGARHADLIRQYPSVFEHGMTDQGWAIELFHLMLKAGHLGHFRIAGNTMEAFMGTILAGDNGGAVSPYDFALGGAGLHPSLPIGQSGVTLKDGMSIMVDIAGNFYGYLTDCTRIFGIGKLDPKAYDAHAVSIAIRNAIMAMAKPGVACADLYTLAIQMATEAGLADCFMGDQQKAKFIGHGTGLVINEIPVLGPRSKETLEAGMCIALEPKFVVRGTGAVGVEDTLLVTPNGMENLTPAPDDIITL